MNEVSGDRVSAAKGIQYVGINEVIATSGVAKRTLYRWLPSKDKLIEEVTTHRATV
ncbi:TetR/AcrR family transcriptional regulator [Fischerella sp. PCC 9605]|uniref:TetR/AcrR family transcriptional regulator n=1 Tax=Fischerella sp. PCC 9605 TaxID=1173024 RepID=UPI0004BB8A24